MAAGSVQKFFEFCSEYDDWQIYSERLDQHFTANQIVDEKVKVAVLLSSVGQLTYKLLRDLCAPDLPKEKGFDQLCALLNKQFGISVSVWRERRKFAKLEQKDETISEWYAKIHSYAAKCNWADKLNFELTNKFVTGMREGRVFDRLCEEDVKESLEDLLALAQKYEGSNINGKIHHVSSSKFPPRRQADFLQHGRPNRFSHQDGRKTPQEHAHFSQSQTRTPRHNFTPRVGNTYQRQSMRGTGQGQQMSLQSQGNRYFHVCLSCGERHQTKFCKFKNVICKLCKIRGHIAKVCNRKSSRVQFVAQENENMGDIQANQEFEVSNLNNDNENYDEKFDLNNIFYCGEVFSSSDSNVCKKNDSQFFVNLTICDRMHKFFFDSGASVSCISNEYFLKYFSSYFRLQRSNMLLKSYNGESFTPLGSFNVNVTYNGETKPLRMYVVENGGQSLLGRNFLDIFQIKVSLFNAIKNENKIEELIKKYDKLFSSKIGKYKYDEVSLKLKENVNPVFRKCRTVPLAYKKEIGKELDRLEAAGILEPVADSRWATPLVPVVKANGKIRLCGDYKVTLNPYLEDFVFPLPKLHEVYSKLNKGKFFSKIDLQMAYNQIPVDDETADMLTVNTTKGLYRVKRLAFGVKPAANIFQKIVETVIRDTKGCCNFLDDIIVSSSSLEEHFNTLEDVFKKLQDAGFTVSAEKCEFLKKEVMYLGHSISAEGLRKTEDKVKSILDAKRPTNLTELRAFLGLVNYYGKFVKNIIDILNPMYELLKNNKEFHWSQNCEIAFNKIKKIMVSDQVLVHFDNELPIIFHSDASNIGISATLSHLVDGEEKLIGCVSRKLTATEMAYPICQKEALSIIFGISKFFYYLCGNKFILKTDHKALTTIFGEHKAIPQYSANRLQRYAAYLSMFDYKIEYIRGKNNVVADYFSRNPLNCEFLGKESLEKGFINFTESSEEWPIDNNKVRQETEKDSILDKVMTSVKTGKWPEKLHEDLKPYFNRREELSIDDKVLLWGHRVVCPLSLRKEILNMLHSSHIGIVQAKKLARSFIYWPNIDRDIENYIKSCIPCLTVKPTPPKNQLTSWPLTTEVFERVHIDFLGPYHGKMYFVLGDAYSKWVEAREMKSTTAFETEEKLRETFARFGLPRLVVSDNGSQLVSKSLLNFYKRNGIDHIATPPYNPRSNGAAESVVKTFKTRLSTALADPRNKEINFSTLISRFLFTYRTTKHSTTNETPAKLMFGRELRSKWQLLRENKADSLERKYPEKAVESALKQKQFYGGQNRTLQVGDIVFVKDFKIANKTSFKKATIEKQIGRSTYLCRLENCQLWKRHVDQIKTTSLKNNNQNTFQPRSPSFSPDQITESTTKSDFNVKRFYNKNSCRCCETEYFINLPTSHSQAPPPILSNNSNNNNSVISGKAILDNKKSMYPSTSKASSEITEIFPNVNNYINENSNVLNSPVNDKNLTLPPVNETSFVQVSSDKEQTRKYSEGFSTSPEPEGKQTNPAVKTYNSATDSKKHTLQPRQITPGRRGRKIQGVEPTKINSRSKRVIKKPIYLKDYDCSDEYHSLTSEDSDN